MKVTLPGLFDLQVNGFGGIDFNAPDLTSNRLDEALDKMRRTGVTRCLPTLITSSFDRFAASARVLARSAHPAIAGIHIEGPYISPEDGTRGAHPREHVALPSIDDFKRRQDAAAGRIVLVTLAPELPGALALIEHLAAEGLRVALGHTAATTPQIDDAIRAGASLATHLGNGCPQLLPRHPNMIWDLLASDAVVASIIADGHHLPATTVKSLIRAKGIRRTILVTDAMAAAACDSGSAPPSPEASASLAEARARSSASGGGKASAERRYSLAGVECELGADGRVSLPGTPYLAGSSLTLDRAIANAVRFTGLTLDDVVPMASTIPAAYMGMATMGTVNADWNATTCDLRICE